MPAPRAVTVDPAGLDTLGEGTRQPEPDPSSFWDPDLTPSSAELLDAERLADQPKAFSIALPSEGRIPEMLWMFEEVDERLCEILQSLLLHHAGSFSQPWVLGTGGGQLSALVHEVDGTAPWLPPRALLESEVVHEPGVRTMSAQDRLLHDCRVHAVSVTHESFEHTERVGQGSCRPGTRHRIGVAGPSDLVTGTSGTSRRSPRRGSSGSSTGAPPAGASRARRTPPRFREEMRNEKTASLEGGGHREFGRWISASRCVPSGEREARDGGRGDPAAQVSAASATAEPQHALDVRRHVGHRLSAVTFQTAVCVRPGAPVKGYSPRGIRRAGRGRPGGSGRRRPGGPRAGRRPAAARRPAP